MISLYVHDNTRLNNISIWVVGIGSWDFFPDLFLHRNSLKVFFSPGAFPISSELSFFEKILVYIMGLFSRTAKQSSLSNEKALTKVLSLLHQRRNAKYCDAFISLYKTGRQMHFCGFFFFPPAYDITQMIMQDSAGKQRKIYQLQE